MNRWFNTIHIHMVVYAICKVKNESRHICQRRQRRRWQQRELKVIKLGIWLINSCEWPMTKFKITSMYLFLNVKSGSITNHKLKSITEPFLAGIFYSLLFIFISSLHEKLKQESTQWEESLLLKQYFCLLLLYILKWNQ